MNLNNHIETLIGISIALVTLFVTQLLFLRIRKRNFKKLNLWNKIYSNQETQKEFDEIYAVARPKKTENSVKALNQEHKAFLKIRSLEIKDNSSKNSKNKSNDSRMVNQE